MKKRPILSVKRAAEIYEEAISCRREYCADSSFFRATDLWEYLCEKSDTWKIKTYRSGETEDFKRKAGVVAFDDRVTLTLDETLWADAKRGNLFYNFMLAHELGHLVLNHHSSGAVTKNFQLYAGPNGMANVPPTAEELETNYAAAFLQCGVALLDPRWDYLQLAKRAFSDPYYVKKAQMVVRLEAFQRHLNRPRPTRERVVL